MQPRTLGMGEGASNHRKVLSPRPGHQRSEIQVSAGCPPSEVSGGGGTALLLQLPVAARVPGDPRLVLRHSSHVALGPTLLQCDFILTHCICKTPSPKEGHVLSFWEGHTRGGTPLTQYSGFEGLIARATLLCPCPWVGRARAGAGECRGHWRGQQVDAPVLFLLTAPHWPSGPAPRAVRRKGGRGDRGRL